VGFFGRFLCPMLGQCDPNEYAVDLRRSPDASPVRRDPPSPVLREQLPCAERIERLTRLCPCRSVRKPPLLQVNGLKVPGLVELCTPHLMHALVIGATERHGRPEPNVEIAEIFESAYQFLGVELEATTL
jgi:hypothetical protein